MDDERWTIRRVLGWMTEDLQRRGFDSPRLDADLLVAKALAVPRIELYLDLDRPLDRDELTKVRRLVERRRQAEPIAYILGSREFYGRSFSVDPAVLVPRPDTETLVDAALEVLRRSSSGRFLDLCTGSGNVAITLALEAPGWWGVATDLSAACLEVAEKNAAALGVGDRLCLRRGDLFAALPKDEPPFDLIVANPPYVGELEREQLPRDVRDHEPPQALFAGPDGYDVLTRIVRDATGYLKPGGAVLLEVGDTQAATVLGLFEVQGFREVRSIPDLAGVARVVGGTAPAQL